MILEALAGFLKDTTSGDTTNAKRQDARQFVNQYIKEVNASRRPRDEPDRPLDVPGSYQITIRLDRILPYNDIENEADILPSYVRVIVWGRDDESATLVPKLNDKVRQSLCDYQGMMGEVEILGVTRDLERDEFPVAPKGGGDQWRHARWTDYKITHTQEVTY